MKKKIAILVLVFLITFSMVFTIFFVKAANENHGKIKFYFEVSFDARINNENMVGNLRNSDGEIGKEAHVPIQTEVHVVAVKKNGDIQVAPFIIEIDGENHEVILDYISMENIDKSSYTKELLQSKVQEIELGIELRIRNYLIISVIAAVFLFFVFSLVFLLIEKKCDSGRKYKILFCFLLFTAILSLFFMIICIQYMRGMR